MYCFKGLRSKRCCDAWFLLCNRCCDAAFLRHTRVWVAATLPPVRRKRGHDAATLPPVRRKRARDVATVCRLCVANCVFEVMRRTRSTANVARLLDLVDRSKPIKFHMQIATLRPLLGQIRFKGFGCAQPRSAQHSSAQPSSDQLSPAQLSPAQLSSVQLSPAQLSLAQLSLA